MEALTPQSSPSLIRETVALSQYSVVELTLSMFLRDAASGSHFLSTLKELEYPLVHSFRQKKTYLISITASLIPGRV